MIICSYSHDAELCRVSESVHVQSGTILSFVPCPAFQTIVVVSPVATQSRHTSYNSSTPPHSILHSFLITVCTRLLVACKPDKSLLASGRPAVVLLLALCAQAVHAEMRVLSEDIMMYECGLEVEDFGASPAVGLVAPLPGAPELIRPRPSEYDLLEIRRQTLEELLLGRGSVTQYGPLRQRHALRINGRSVEALHVWSVSEQGE